MYATVITFCLSIRLSVCPSVRPSVCLSICTSVYLSVCLSVLPSLHLSVRPSVCLSIRTSVHPSVRLSVCHTGDSYPNGLIHCAPHYRDMFLVYSSKISQSKLRNLPGMRVSNGGINLIKYVPITLKFYKVGPVLVLFANRKSHNRLSIGTKMSDLE